MSIIANFQTRILCEDVRNELGNKRTLVGVFSGDIVVERFPATISLAAFFEYTATDKGQQRVEFSIYYNNEKMFDVGGMLTVEEPGKAIALALPRINVTVQQQGEVKIEVTIPPSLPETLIVKQVIAGSI